MFNIMEKINKYLHKVMFNPVIFKERNPTNFSCCFYGISNKHAAFYISVKRLKFSTVFYQIISHSLFKGTEDCKFLTLCLSHK